MDALGISLAVGRLTLNQVTLVRIQDPQPYPLHNASAPSPAHPIPYSPSREIAQEMPISETTVKRTLRQAFEKLGHPQPL